MAINVSVPVKAFAHLSHTEGVPLSELKTSVGDVTLANLATRALNGISSYTNSVEITGGPADRTQHDSLIVRVTSGADPSYRSDHEITIDDFFLITERQEGQTIVDSADTGKNVSGTHGTIVVGRTNTNKILFANNDLALTGIVAITVLSKSHKNGLLDRRLSILREHHTKTEFVHTRSSTVPAAPTGLVYDGETFEYPESSPWRNLDEPLTGNDQEYLASVEVSYDYDIGAWTIGTTNVIEGGSNFSVQYGTSETGPWTATVPDTIELWVRYRLTDGTWSVHQTRTAATVGILRPTLLTSVLMAQNTSTIDRRFPTASYSWADRFMFELIYQQFETNADDAALVNERRVLIPADRVRSTTFVNRANLVDVTVQGLLNSLLQTYSMGTGANVVSATTGQHDCPFRFVTFVNSSGEDGDVGTNNASWFRFIRYYTSVQGRFILRLW